jgi:hypothetical protein
MYPQLYEGAHDMTDKENKEKGATAPVVSRPSMSPPEMMRLFGRPTLLASEDPAAYEALWGNVMRDVQPRDMVECIFVRRYVDLNWEIARFQRCTAGIINVTSRNAVGRILADLAPGGIDGHTPDRLAELWFTDARIRVRALSHLQKFQVDEDTVSSLAIAMRAGELAKITDMRARAEIQALAVLRELDRYRGDSERRAMTLINAPKKAEEMSLVPADGRP